MSVNRTRLAMDLTVSAVMPLLGLWLYELSNWIALVLQGYSVSFTASGLLPLGVAGVSSGGISPLTKVLQVVFAILAVLPLGAIFSRKRLHIAEILTVSTIGIYLMSAYWELLSSLSLIPMAAHTAIFVAGASATSFVLLSEVERPHRFLGAVTGLAP